MSFKEIAKEIKATIVIVLAIGLILLSIKLAESPIYQQWFICSIILLVIFYGVLIILNKNIKSRFIESCIKFISIPLGVVFAILIFAIPVIALFYHVLLYFIISFLIPFFTFFLIDFFNLLQFLEPDTKLYIQFTTGMFICVLLNSVIRSFVYAISPARIKKSEKMKPYQLDKLTDYLLSAKNIRYLAYFAYFIVIVTVNYFDFQNIDNLEPKYLKEVLLQSFITFIAFDGSVLLLKTLDFRPSAMIQKVKNSISEKVNQLDKIKNNATDNIDKPGNMKRIPPADQKFSKYVKPNLVRRYWSEILVLIIGMIAMNLIFIAKTFRETNTINPVGAGQLGDFVGGFIGTFFALASVVFLYSTLKSQRESTKIQAFETKYFELIKMHRDNVSEIGIGSDFGRKIFVIMIRELRCILEILDEVAEIHKQNFEKEERLVIAYYALFYGVGPNSSRMLIASLKKFNPKFVEDFEKALNNKDTKTKYKSKRGFRFTPFEGHQSRLGHYYRHLFQAVSYVDEQDLAVDKYNFVKTIRAQLTTHEQALLFINCLTPVGHIWWEKELITRYRFVKNIPNAFFNPDTEIDIESYFRNDYFEWQENSASKDTPMS